MTNIEKWTNISCVVNTARFLKYVWSFENIMNKSVKSAMFWKSCGAGKISNISQKNKFPADLVRFTEEILR